MMDIRNNVCRTCLRGDFPLTSLDLKLGDRTPARKMLEFLLGCAVETFEKFGEICEPCRRDLALCYYFKQQCLVSEEKVKDHMKKATEPILEAPEPPIISMPVVPFDTYSPSAPLGSESSSESSQDDWMTVGTPINMVNKKRKAPLNYTRSMRRKNVKFNLISYANSLLQTRKAEDEAENSSKASRERYDRLNHEDHHENVAKYDESKGFYTCKKCPKTFNKRNHRMHHMRVVHGLGGKYKCTYCTKSYGEKDELEMHKLQHKNILPHECSFCQNRFKTLTELRDHMDTHLNDTEEDEEVVWGPKLPPNLQNEKIPSDENSPKKSIEKPTEFICEICKNSYVQIDVLRFHMRITHPEHAATTSQKTT